MSPEPARLAPLDLAIIGGYLAVVVLVGLWVSRRATKGLDSFFLGDRRMPWWVLGLSGCSSYIDIGGTMGMVGLMFYTGFKSVWLTHVWWGWFIICFYMAFQAKYIRRSGVMTFAEWNRTRFGEGRDAEAARLAAAVFLLVLMVCNLMYIAVGIGKFAQEFLPWDPSVSKLAVFGAVGVYVIFGGILGVIYTDLLQTVLIALGAVLLTALVVTAADPGALLRAKDPAWGSLSPSWTLWEGYGHETEGTSYGQYFLLGPLLLGAFPWCVFRVLAGPNVWDFQFFLTARSARDAALAGGLWTVGYTLRWILASAFLVLGFHFLGSAAGADAERIMPQVLVQLSTGLRGLFLAILLAALMSTLDAMINVTSSVVTNDLLKRHLGRRLSERALVRCGQAACGVALLLGFSFSLLFRNVNEVWEAMIFVVVTMILVPATFRWHWWRFGARAFVAAMAGTAAFIVLQKVLLPGWPAHVALAASVLASLALSLGLGFLLPPADREVLVRFYASVRPFGVWGPIRREAAARGLVPARDRLPALDLLNGFLTLGLQVSLCLIPFCGMFGRAREAILAALAAAALGVVLYFTWYRVLPARDEEAASTPSAAGLG